MRVRMMIAEKAKAVSSCPLARRRTYPRPYSEPTHTPTMAPTTAKVMATFTPAKR